MRLGREARERIVRLGLSDEGARLEYVRNPLTSEALVGEEVAD